MSGTLRLHTDEVEEQADGIAHARHSHVESREEGVVGMERTGLEFRAAGVKSEWRLSKHMELKTLSLLHSGVHK